MSLIPSSNHPLAYLGTNATTPPNIITSNRAPTSADFRGYNIGDIWVDDVGDNAYILVSLANNLAVWNLAAASTGDLSTLTGNSGGPVSPLLANINLVGDGTTINVVGNPATHTLTISAAGSTATSFVTDSGTANPIADVLHINGDPNITTTGATNVVHVDLNQAVVVTSYSTATPTPIADSLLISGNTIQAAGTATDVGLNLTAKGIGPIVNTTQNVTTTQDSSTFTVDTSAAGASGQVEFLTQNTQIVADQNTVTLNTTAAGSSGTISFNTSAAPLFFNGESTINYILSNGGGGTGDIASAVQQRSINTTNNTPTTIASGGLMVAGRLVTLECIVQGTSTTTGTDSTFARVWASAAYYTAAGSAVLVGTPVIDLNTTNLSTAVTASVVANQLVVQVTGITAETWEWTAQSTGYLSTIV